MLVSAFYTSILTLLIVFLSIVVIRSRRKNKVVFADGGVSELTIARSAHANATEYIPITLLLMFGVESNGGYSVLIHIFGIVFVLGRVIHARGILKEDIKKRVLGMQLTFAVIIGLVLMNGVYLLIPFLPV